jgi:hypothetical protein
MFMYENQAIAESTVTYIFLSFYKNNHRGLYHYQPAFESADLEFHTFVITV